MHIDINKKLCDHLCEHPHKRPMATNLQLDDALIEDARTLGSHRTKREAVNAALVEYVARRRRRRMLDLFGSLDWNEDYDYKAARQKR